jgi:hypothetical protein
MPIQVDAPARERDALHFEPQPLFERVLTWRADRAAGADHTVPRQSVERVESPNHLSRGSWKSSRGGDLSVGGDLSARNLPNRVRENNEKFTSLRCGQFSPPTYSIRKYRNECWKPQSAASGPRADAWG